MSEGKLSAANLRRLETGGHLALIAGLVTWFYWPFLETGLPPGDFGSTVMVSTVQDRLVQPIWSWPTWNPYLMCGRPCIAYLSPFRLLAVPLLGLEPILRMKALLVVFHVLGGFTTYWLVRDLGAGRVAALFGGLVYPIMASHVSRTAVHGHVQIPMYFALIPLLFLALFRLKRWDVRGTVVLGFVLLLCLYRDVQRTLLMLVTMAVLVGALLALELGRAAYRNVSWRSGRWLPLAVSVSVAFVLAVTFDAFDIVNGFIGDPYQGGWATGEQAYWIKQWSLTNVFTVVDRDGLFAEPLSKLSDGFYVSISRYVGLSVLALAAFGALFPKDLGPLRRPFWFMLALFPISLWLSFGTAPIFPSLVERWAPVFRSDGSFLAKAACALVILALPVLFVLVVGRNLKPGRWRWQAAVGLVALALSAFLFTVPMPLVQRFAFFLRDFRNPDWFQVAVASLATVVPAALAVGALMRRLAGTRYQAPVAVALLALGVADFAVFRSYLTKYQRSSSALEVFQEVNAIIAADPEDVRVIGAEKLNNIVDTSYIWHEKRLAWDFRGYSAPRRTWYLMNAFHRLINAGDTSPLPAAIIGLANVKYVLDESTFPPNAKETAYIRPVRQTRRFSLFENTACRPYVQAYASTVLLHGDLSETGAELAAALSMQDIGFVHVTEPPGDELVRSCDQHVVQVGSGRETHAPRGATLFRPGQPLPISPRTWSSPPPELSWERPAPERIQVRVTASEPFLLVVAESFHPWWSARLDGEPRAVHAGGFAFLGVFVPEGEHVVDLRFRRPWHFWFFWVVSAASTIGAAAWLWRTRGRRTDGPELLR